MAPKSIKMLSGLNTAELTLTVRGANGKRFAMTKSGGFPMEPEVLEAIMKTQAEGEVEFVETLKSQGLDEDKINAAVASYRMQKGLKDLVDNDVMNTVAKAAGYQVASSEPKPAPKADPKPEPTAKSMDLSALDPATRAQVEAVFKSHASMAEKAAQVDELQLTVKSLLDDASKKTYVAKAASEYSHVPGSHEEIGVMLKSAHEFNPKFGETLESILSKVNEVVQKSSLLTTMGSVDQMSASGAWAKIEALADGIVQKSYGDGQSMSKQKALDIVLKSDEGKALYAEYLRENPKQSQG